LLREPSEGRTGIRHSSVIRSRKRIERVLRWDTDADAADTEWVGTDDVHSRKTTKVRHTSGLNGVGAKAAIPKWRKVLKVSKHGQVFVANIAVEEP